MTPLLTMCQDFDGRFAAAESLRSFFAICGDRSTTDECLPALMALYDVLNDDDDEVRHVGSAAARGLLGRSLVPIEAANALLKWLVQTFGNSPTFRAIVAARVTGANGTLDASVSWTSAERQLNKALAFDDSLFIIEENNLFVDEAREARRWSTVLKLLPRSSADKSMLQLDRWLVDGLKSLQNLIEQKDDGPLGWASTPGVFAVCARLLSSSTSLLSMGYRSKDLEDAHESIRMTAMRARYKEKDALSALVIDLQDAESFF